MLIKIFALWGIVETSVIVISLVSVLIEIRHSVHDPEDRPKQEE